MRPGPAPSSTGGGGDGGKLGPGRKGGGAGRGRSARPPESHAHWSYAPSVWGRGTNAGQLGGAGAPCVPA